MDGRKIENTEIKGIGITMPEHRKAADAINGPVYPIGAKITDSLGAIYTVEDGPVYGGMGRVYKVRHTDWDIPLAMKKPLPGKYLSGEMQALYEAECETWVRFGAHPNVAACHYVRDVDGIPSMFYEWMESGTLSGLIKSGALYEGGEKEIQKRILRIAYDMAQGISHIAAHGCIHGDIKPSNVLIAKDGTAKISDLGTVTEAWSRLDYLEYKAICGDKVAQGDLDASGTGDSWPQKYSAYIKGRPGTPASLGIRTALYAAPEQFYGCTRITTLADIFSFALVLSEMYLGHPLHDADGGYLGKGDDSEAYGESEGAAYYKNVFATAKVPMHTALQDFVIAALMADDLSRRKRIEALRADCVRESAANVGTWQTHVAKAPIGFFDSTRFWQGFILPGVIMRAYEDQLGRPFPEGRKTWTPIPKSGIDTKYLDCVHNWQKDKHAEKRTSEYHDHCACDSFLHCAKCGLKKEIHGEFFHTVSRSDRGIVSYTFPGGQTVLLNIQGHENRLLPGLGDTPATVAAGMNSLETLLMPQIRKVIVDASTADDEVRGATKETGCGQTSESMVASSASALRALCCIIERHITAMHQNGGNADRVPPGIAQLIRSLTNPKTNSHIAEGAKYFADLCASASPDEIAAAFVHTVPLDEMEKGKVRFDETMRCGHCGHEGLFYGETYDASGGTDLVYNEYRFCPNCFANYNHSYYTTQDWD